MASERQLPDNSRSSKDDSLLSRFLKPPSTNMMSTPAQAGCSTLRGGGYRNKVALKPGHSAMDWSVLSNTKGKTGKLVTGIEKLLADPEIHKINNPQALKALQHGVPAFKIYPPLKITMAHLKQHKSADDCWCVIGNKVYCIASYLDFHPGGAEILLKSAAGRNGTAMFEKYHRWVNYERLLETSYVGTFIP
ncbi:LAFA_0F07954g1_1 [Lachancea sp. 'fantastica']|nr:LAFA_0F07954g1_1 [Lachancea sp. 'fantastica']